jgi:dihydrofolate reductase
VKQGSGLSPAARRVSIIVAMAKNRVIGTAGRIPWHLPNELQLFKRVTMGHHIIMGRKTWESIGRALPGRVSVVVTRKPDYAAAGAVVTQSLSAALDVARSDDEPFVIGGAELFEAAMPCARRLYLTEVSGDHEGDVWVPELELEQWRELRHEHHAASATEPAWDFRVYERITALRTPQRP